MVTYCLLNGADYQTDNPHKSVSARLSKMGMTYIEVNGHYVWNAKLTQEGLDAEEEDLRQIILLSKENQMIADEAASEIKALLNDPNICGNPDLYFAQKQIIMGALKRRTNANNIKIKAIELEAKVRKQKVELERIRRQKPY